MNWELWRLLSGHLVHLSWNHWWLNAVALVLLAMLFESAWQADDVIFGGLFSAVAISVSLYLWHPTIQWYVGLSGLLHGWFAIAGIRLLSHQPGFAGLLLLALAAKLMYENTAAPSTDTAWLGGEVIEQAHLLGAVSGLLYAAINAGIRRYLAKHA